MAGRHRKPSRLPAARTSATVLCAALVVTAATLTAFADDPRLLRAGALIAMLAILLPVTMLQDARPRTMTTMERELRQLRADVARLSVALSAVPVAAPRSQTVVPERTTMLSLPLVRAALQVPVQSANGHEQLIDITDDALARRD